MGAVLIRLLLVVQQVDVQAVDRCHVDQRCKDVERERRLRHLGLTQQVDRRTSPKSCQLAREQLQGRG